MLRKVSQSGPQIGSERRRARSLHTSMHSVKHARPAGSRRQMGDGFENAGEPLNECARAVVRTAGLHRPIDEKWTAHDGVTIDKSPVAAVGTLIAIVAHGEIFAGGDDDLIALNRVLGVGGPFGNHL